MDIFDKNYDRDIPSFANINLLGTCNMNCYFCLGKDLEEEFSKTKSENIHFSEWKNLDKFLLFCKRNNIKNIYITGQNTDPLLYQYLKELIEFLQKDMEFSVGVRTNGLLAAGLLDVLNLCKRTVGYTIHSFNKESYKKITGIEIFPDWKYILSNTKNSRVSIVVNRYNFEELLDLIKFAASFDNVKYIQLRRVSTDTRKDLLRLDAELFEKIAESFKKMGESRNFAGAEIISLFGKDVVLWRTVKTRANSFNYYTDGIFTDEYFIIEGYLKAIFGTRREDFQWRE